ncbi:XrtA/PEP-CTERM system histidine kinase PrsK [Sphingomonas sp.]|uniref:XrtA/PEP-CTERM system histidine kinase PrsK n=1 Tax=Sphingomonas sp. TaxID=28214 RepID=UPI002C3BA555|nr:XrtA/PEP-CTERM system histidine kinase PrsK [Sphingomonas sp.]HTG38192.1 XrtA/PEP-CTERM system histidine kinase PrsK [Sphingomonas sp.]
MSGPADILSLWSHALASLLFAMLALWAWRAPLRRNVQVIAFAATAFWALAAAAFGGTAGVSRLLEAGRNLAWLALVWQMQPAFADVATRRSSILFHVTLAVIFALAGVIGFAAAMVDTPSIANGLSEAGVVLPLLAAVAALVLVQNAHARAATMAVRTAALAIAAIWLVDANLLTLAWATGEWPDTMVATRGAVLVAVAAVFAANMQRDGERPVQLSRTVAFQSLSLLAVLSYLAIFAGAIQGIEAVAGRHARVLQTIFVFGSTAAALAFLSTPKLRAWVRVKAAKHLFRHRYDYRDEWMRFTETLSRREGDATLDERVARAVAELVDAPAALLLTCEAGALTLSAHWRWTEPALPAAPDGGGDLARHLAATGRVIELDAVRVGASALDADAVPATLCDLEDGWAIVPLPHQAGLVGAVVLARPLIPRQLDWEDFDLLKLASHQAANALAENRAQARLADAERFEEFNRRFAFILHDIKNLVSQLSLLARNAERHADNPDFRADMVATLNESATRMGDLVTRLSQSRSPRTESPRPVALMAIAEALAVERRLIHPVIVTGDASAIAHADSGGVEQILRHLIQNAIEASAAGDPVGVCIAAVGQRVMTDVIDHGCGMSPAFVRERLFRPFVSTKASGFGIGAYEARSLALAMGGSIEVRSREGEGSRFRLILPAAIPGRMERAA